MEPGSGEGLRFVGREFCTSGDCVEAARLANGDVALRSSLAAVDSAIVVTASEWSAVLGAVKAAKFDVV